jgi:SAM-dependent methyltransferase
MNRSGREQSLAEKPLGLKGIILAHFMGVVHKAEYEAVAASLKLGSDDVYLEVGCGSGLFMHKYASNVKFMAGLDHSEDMVAMAARQNRVRVLAGSAELQRGDASELPWEDESFSAAAAIATFMFWPNPLESLKEICRVLQSGGRLVIGLGWNADDGRDHTKHVRKYGLKLYTGQEMQSMLEKAGFSRISISYMRAFMTPKAMIVHAVR